MPYLTKVNSAAKEKAAAPPRPVAPIVVKNLDAFTRIHRPASDNGIAKIEVHDAVSNVAWAYEKLRNAIDYQDEHLQRKNTIDRILKRRLVAGVGSEQVAEPLILELIRGRYLPNNELPVTLITQASDVINAYINLWSQVPALPDHRRMERLFDWFTGLLAVQINELIAPTDHEEALVEIMFETTNRDITFAEGELGQGEKETQLYIAIHRALLKSDPQIVAYHLFLRQFPDWAAPSVETVNAIGEQLPSVQIGIEAAMVHPAGELLQRLMKKYAIIFWIYDDIARKRGATAKETMALPTTLDEDIRTAYTERQKVLHRKISRNVVRSIIYVFITKMLITLVIELPIDRLLAGTSNISLIPLLINIGFPPLLLLLIGVSIRVPGKKNLAGVIEKVEALVYRGDERNALVRARKPIRRSTLFTFIYRIVYGLAFLIVFGLILWGLSQFAFTFVSSLVFLLFLTIVSFFGIRVRLLAKELVVVDQRENIFTVLFDFFTVPILQVGRWISMRAPKVNVFIFFLDVIIEAPFKAILEAAEGFFGFLREKREEIY